MPTFVNADPEIAKLVKELGGTVVRTGSKPWAHFHGGRAAENGLKVVERYQSLYGIDPRFAGPPWNEDTKKRFDYAVRLDP